MITTVFHIALLRLWNNKQELLLTLVVPILFFSIFALIFGRGVGSDTAAIKVAIVDDDMSALTQDIIRLVREQPAIQTDSHLLQTNDEWPLTKLTRVIIRVSGADIVVYLPSGMERSLEGQAEVAVQLLSEGTNPVARQIVSSMLSQVVAVAWAQNQRDRQFISSAEPLPTPSPGPQSQRHLTHNVDGQSGQPDSGNSTQPGTWERKNGDLISFESTDVFAVDKHNPKIAMYAAGIAVMFLLFSATGAGGSLLEEYEAGTLDRLLTSRLTVTELLAGKWLYITCLGCVQLTVMFAWAQLVFGVDLLGHLSGFAVMTLCTSATTASLAVCLAVFCRSRTQLNSVSIVLILTMSALGGSMVPRYIMSPEMQRWGQLTFNAWRIDGFKKVFWYDLPLSALDIEVKVLLSMSVILACLGRIFADRWQAD